MTPLLLALTLLPAGPTTAELGPALGQRLPAFEAQAQDGRQRSFDSLSGPKGLVLVFFRSADWWPYCKSQLVELESQVEAFRKRGLEIAALSYDPAPVLKDFATRRNISFPLLSDPDSAIIRRFGLLNLEYPEGDPVHGVPHPMTFIVDGHGVIRSKFFEGGYATRRTAASILTLEGAATGPVQEVPAERLGVHTSLSNAAAYPGNRVTLVVDIDVPEGLHAYAPGSKGYRALDLRLEPQPLVAFSETAYPAPHPYVFLPLQETLSVFEGRVRLLRDLTLAGGKDLADVLRSADPTLTIHGKLDYQACSDRVCYPPRTLPLSWTLKVRPLER